MRKIFAERSPKAATMASLNESVNTISSATDIGIESYRMNTVTRRHPDHERFLPRQSHRYYVDSFGWWVQFREGTKGPFATAGLAEAYAESYLSSVKST